MIGRGRAWSRWCATTLVVLALTAGVETAVDAQGRGGGNAQRGGGGGGNNRDGRAAERRGGAPGAGRQGRGAGARDTPDAAAGALAARGPQGERGQQPGRGAAPGRPGAGEAARADAQGNRQQREVVNETASRIGDSQYAVRLARDMSPQAQRDVDHLVGELRSGNINGAGLGSRPLGRGFTEMRGPEGGRVIVKQTGERSYDIVGKFQAHARGDRVNTQVINRLMRDYGAR
jgi:hypothetical protein